MCADDIKIRVNAAEDAFERPTADLDEGDCSEAEGRMRAMASLSEPGTIDQIRKVG